MRPQPARSGEHGPGEHLAPGADLTDSILTKAVFSGANLRGAGLDRAAISGVRLWGGTCAAPTSAGPRGTTRVDIGV
ncbi:pentapeptide repeat-containing protein [Streptomyces sp. NPDC058289]|uniref:pentapeptide repeat-containing protein n=1 Tax=Streptomyces sp. NPDC058289 TaxID=3346425 RepID=UPI0036E9D83F